MAPNDQQRHVSRAQLHAYARGEVDPAQRAVVEAHLAACPECRDRLRRVEGLTQLLSEMGGASLDDIRWRRIREVVRSQLEVDALQPATSDLLWARRWGVPALAAAAVVGLMVWAAILQRRPAPTPVTEANAPDRDEQRLASGAAPLAVTLASGTRLELEPRTRIRATNPSGPRVELNLTVGAVRVRTPRRPDDGSTLTLTTPEYRLVSRSEDFSAGYWRRRSFVDVRAGEVTVTGDDYGTNVTILAGQRRRVPKDDVGRADASTDRLEPRPATAGRAESAPSPRGRSDTETSASTSRRGVVSKSDQGTVTVDVEAPDDPVLSLWREANEAYYKRRDLRATVELADRVVALGGPHARGARQLLCDAQISLEDGEAALAACKGLLEVVRSEEDRRNVHYTVGTIYRALLGDCASAIEHFNKALVFGRKHILDDEVRISRATCALEVGDIALAERDVGSLSARAGRLARPEDVTLLQRRLAAAKKEMKADASVRTD